MLLQVLLFCHYACFLKFFFIYFAEIFGAIQAVFTATLGMGIYAVFFI